MWGKSKCGKNVARLSKMWQMPHLCGKIVTLTLTIDLQNFNYFFLNWSLYYILLALSGFKLYSLALLFFMFTIIHSISYNFFTVLSDWCSIFASNKISIYKSSPQGLMRYQRPFDTKYHSKLKDKLFVCL